MNQTSRTDEPYEGDGLNQSPNAFSNDLVTNEDMNGIANARERRGCNSRSMVNSGQPITQHIPVSPDEDDRTSLDEKGLARGDGQSPEKPRKSAQVNNGPAAASVAGSPRRRGGPTSLLQKVFQYIVTLGKFVGPGFLVAVAYIDPGNYSTGISAGAWFRFRLLFIILLSNLFAILLQCLAVKLGTVTGLNLAEACRAFLPRWLNYFLYFLAEAAIIATDIAEVSVVFLIPTFLFPPQRKFGSACLLTNRIPGHRHGYRAQFADSCHPHRRWMCPLYPGRFRDPLLLSADRIHERPPHLRDLRHASGLDRHRLLRHSALAHQGYQPR